MNEPPPPPPLLEEPEPSCPTTMDIESLALKANVPTISIPEPPLPPPAPPATVIVYVPDVENTND